MTPIDDGNPASEASLLPRHLCRVMGLNQNHSSRSGTPYHVQIEDRGPIFDDATEAWVRRVNVIAYANYGEPTARIVYGKDHDLPDVRTHEHNRDVAQRIQELAAEVALVLEEKEERQVGAGEEPARALLPRRATRRQARVRGGEPALPASSSRAPSRSCKAEPNPRRPRCRLPPARALHAVGGGRLPARPAPARARARDRARGARSCSATCRRSRRGAPPTTSCRPPARSSWRGRRRASRAATAAATSRPATWR